MSDTANVIIGALVWGFGAVCYLLGRASGVDAALDAAKEIGKQWAQDEFKRLREENQ